MNFEKKVVFWMRKKLKESGAKGFVVGLSGGVDSAVAAALAKKAGTTLAVIMPCHSQTEDIAHATLLVKKLHLNSKIVDLGEIYEKLLAVLPGKPNKKTLGNLKARLRMLVLYYFANKENLLVVGTGNKTELTLGYFTKYGDGGCDILPLGDLLKREVRKLAWQLGIPEEIIKKPPSAGLWKGQTDEKEIGASYKILDDFVSGKNINPKIRKKLLVLKKRALQKLQKPSVFKK